MNSFSEGAVDYSEISFSSTSSSSNLMRTYPDANFVIRSLSNNHQVQKLFLKSSPQEIDAWISLKQVALHALVLESGSIFPPPFYSSFSLSSFSLSRNFWASVNVGFPTLPQKRMQLAKINADMGSKVRMKREKLREKTRTAKEN